MLVRPIWRRREHDPSHCCCYVCCRCCRTGSRLRIEPICRGEFSVHRRVTSAAEQAGESASPLIGRFGRLSRPPEAQLSDCLQRTPVGACLTGRLTSASALSLRRSESAGLGRLIPGSCDDPGHGCDRRSCHHFGSDATACSPWARVMPATIAATSSSTCFRGLSSWVIGGLLPSPSTR